MSARLAITIACEVSDCPEESQHSAPTIKEARALARPDGWHHNNGRDIGPDCWSAGWRWGRDGWTVG